MLIKYLIPPVFIVIYRKLSSKTKNTYEIGKYKIEIPPKHTLPDNQKKHKLYDRFLPILAKYLTSQKIIVDVGSNIGDTAIAVLQQCENPIICIEPSDFFFPYLEKNLKKLTNKYLRRMKIFNKFAGTGKIYGKLDHSLCGTATLRISTDTKGNTHIPLDNLIEDTSNVILIKVDTDGFDFDVIKSAEKILSDSEPILYWENQITEEFQYKGFIELYTLLIKKGYKYIYIFDNYGNLITEESNFDTLKNINTYVYSMEKYGCTRSFFYTDILATTEKNYFIVKNAINEYKKEWINNKRCDHQQTKLI